MPPRRQSQPRSPEHAALGDAIRIRREKLGLSQEALADAAGVHVTHLGGVERGVRNPNYTTIVRIADALGVSPGALITAADKLRADRGSRRGPKAS
jgi:transcriptional regulator with XRE-family HTH domain